jgi:NitT/TauT family transport system permease protein
MAEHRIFRTGQPTRRTLPLGDALVLLGLAGLLYAGARLAIHAPAVVTGPTITLDPRALPWYALLSVGRMAAAYALSMLFSLVYGYQAAYHRRVEQVLMPLLDVLQSVPILSLLNLVWIGLSSASTKAQDEQE